MPSVVPPPFLLDGRPLVDIRAQPAIEARHVAGSVWIPADDVLKDRSLELPPRGHAWWCVCDAATAPVAARLAEAFRGDVVACMRADGGDGAAFWARIPPARQASG